MASPTTATVITTAHHGGLDAHLIRPKNPCQPTEADRRILDSHGDMGDLWQFELLKILAHICVGESPSTLSCAEGGRNQGRR